LASSLGIDRTFFDSKMDRAMASLRLLHYPPQAPASVDAEHLGAGAHSDYGLATFLAQDRSGLQVRNRAREWIAVPVVDGAFVVNLGDMTQRWTNDLYVSTPHRVINNVGEHHRYSLPFFYEVRTAGRPHATAPLPRAGRRTDLSARPPSPSLPGRSQPNIDARIEVIPECTSADRPARYPPITFGEHLKNMYVKTF
jgi:isopenicillin N synthase-like dioxygenase